MKTQFLVASLALSLSATSLFAAAGEPMGPARRMANRIYRAGPLPLSKNLDATIIRMAWMIRNP